MVALWYTGRLVGVVLRALVLAVVVILVALVCLALLIISVVFWTVTVAAAAGANQHWRKHNA